MKNLIWIISVVALLTSACGKAGGGGNSSSTTGEVADQLHAGLDHRESGDEEGTDRGNGADVESPIANSAWYADPERVVKYCMEVSPGFGVTADVAHGTFQRAVARWAEYYKNKEFVLIYRKVGLSFKFQRSNECDGEQDLTIYLGVKSDETEKAAGAFDKPWAFSVQKEYDAKSRWGKGYMWFADAGIYSSGRKPFSKQPDWTRSGSLEVLMTHELGHVFGIGHIAGTIMDEGIAKTVVGKVKNENVPRWKFEIDQTMELLGGLYSGALGLPENQKSNFQLLVGRKSRGAVSALVIRENKYKYTLKIKDDRGEVSLGISADPESLIVTCQAEPVFKVALNERQAVYDTYLCTTLLAQIKLPNGKAINVQILNNIDATASRWDSSSEVIASSRFSVMMFEGGSAKILFQSVL